ncbi:MAG: hypothetical protein Q8L79_01760 [Methylobacter sp.]|uniref:hypothetical protein n=1 Tax=Methylobacter sp. TaxID=2051955 RepID=UPI0027318502|nr:hypothetical protein [Methylobacter sp.]MDP1663823.1 hypothetical protein [Methylobacter sp.]MDP1970128.1 hypothetical protein [Methylobacter sp.]
MKRTILFTAMLALSSFAITGCEQEKKTAKASQTAVKKYAQATVLEGVVSNDKGVIKTGTVEVSDESGRLITRATVDSGHYSVEVPANTILPILLTFASESGTEKLVTAVIHDTITKYEINPSTTSIARAAKAMGGYTHANMTRAAADTIHTPDANKTTTGWRGDPTTQYGGWH